MTQTVNFEQSMPFKGARTLTYKAPSPVNIETFPCGGASKAHKLRRRAMRAGVGTDSSLMHEMVGTSCTIRAMSSGDMWTYNAQLSHTQRWPNYFLMEPARAFDKKVEIPGWRLDGLAVQSVVQGTDQQHGRTAPIGHRRCSPALWTAINTESLCQWPPVCMSFGPLNEEFTVVNVNTSLQTGVTITASAPRP